MHCYFMVDHVFASTAYTLTMLSILPMLCKPTGGLLCTTSFDSSQDGPVYHPIHTGSAQCAELLAVRWFRTRTCTPVEYLDIPCHALTIGACTCAHHGDAGHTAFMLPWQGREPHGQPGR